MPAKKIAAPTSQQHYEQAAAKVAVPRTSC